MRAIAAGQRPLLAGYDRLVTDAVVLAYPEPIVPVTVVRSTVLLSSVAALREAGHYDLYLAALPREFHEPLLESVVGMWLPLAVATAHYRACDSLVLSADSQAKLGRAVFDRTKGTLLGTAVRLAQNAGVTPWTVFPYFQRFWLRGYDGGGIRVTRVGPKEALIEVVSVGLLDVPYYRSALRGLLTGVIALFCRQAYVHERPGGRRSGEATYRAQWA